MDHPDSGAWAGALNALVEEYLVHAGYAETAMALSSAQGSLNSQGAAATMTARRRMFSVSTFFVQMKGLR